MTALTVPESYRQAHRYDGAAVEHGRRSTIEPCAVQPRDLAIVHDVYRYKFLTAPQLRELWWPNASVQAADRRLLRLFRAGLLERFRPWARRGLGSFPWTYHLGEEGHRLLHEAGALGQRKRFRRRTIFDYGYVLHEVHLNAWVLAYKRALGPAFHSWEGETAIDPPPNFHPSRAELDDDWSVEGLAPGPVRPVYPDAVLEIAGETPEAESRLILVEYDRTRRIDKNFDKFIRYDAFLTAWWQHAEAGRRAAPPFVLFVCQDEEQRDLFLDAADGHLCGHHWHPDVDADGWPHPARQRILFASERDAHGGSALAHRVPAVPAGHAGRRPEPRRVLVGPSTVTAASMSS